MSMVGAGVGAAVGSGAAGGLHTHQVCPTSMTEVVVPGPIYTESEYVYEK